MSAQRWEYMTWLVGYAHPTEGEHFGHRGGRVKFINGEKVKDWAKGATLPAWLQQAGAEGWELVNFHLPDAGRGLQAGESGDGVFIFKRPARD
jgi:hypothetical protein